MCRPPKIYLCDVKHERIPPELDSICIYMALEGFFRVLFKMGPKFQGIFFREFSGWDLGVQPAPPGRNLIERAAGSTCFMTKRDPPWFRKNTFDVLLVFGMLMTCWFVDFKDCV